MSNERKNTWLLVALIAGALIVWMGLLAAGAYWAPVGEKENGNDFRKLWVVAATTGGFLLLWAGVLLRVQSKLRRRRAAGEEEDVSDGGGGGDGRG